MRAATILFCACDRHNFGDLLFPHVLTRLLDRPCVIAGLAARDLRAAGGHLVQALAALRPRLQQPLNLIHAGGEILSCRAAEAAVMLGLPPQAQSGFDGARLPYVASPLQWPQARLLFNAVGGAELAGLDADSRTELLDKLRAAAWLGVRDWRTQHALTAAGIDSVLMPDPAVLVAELFSAPIAQAAGAATMATLRARHARGYLAVQCSAEFGTEDCLQQLGQALDVLARELGLGIVLLRAGAAPWHDDLEVYVRLQQRMRTPTSLWHSLDLWDICAVIAGSQGWCGSSLHGRIVAAAHGLPHITLLRGDAALPGKHLAWAETWERDLFDAQHGCVTPRQAPAAMTAAYALPRARLHEHARDLAAQYRARFRTLQAALVQ